MKPARKKQNDSVGSFSLFASFGLWFDSRTPSLFFFSPGVHTFFRVFRLSSGVHTFGSRQIIKNQTENRFGSARYNQSVRSIGGPVLSDRIASVIRFLCRVSLFSLFHYFTAGSLITIHRIQLFKSFIGVPKSGSLDQWIRDFH